jgi:hypothetical protein
VLHKTDNNGIRNRYIYLNDFFTILRQMCRTLSRKTYPLRRILPKFFQYWQLIFSLSIVVVAVRNMLTENMSCKFSFNIKEGKTEIAIHWKFFHRIYMMSHTKAIKYERLTKNNEMQTMLS